MAEPVFFSVIVPVYNVAPYLRSCLDSILDQGWTALELLLVDDGSTDESGAICDEYAARDTRMRVFHRENGGPFAARCYAVGQAKGDYFLFVDSDDQLLPGAFETLAAAIRESGADCLIYGARRETAGGELHVVSPPSLCGRLMTDRRAVLNILINDNTYNALWRKCARASCFDGRDFSPLYHIRLGEDLIQSTEILENARSFFFLPQELYLYRLNRGSLTKTVCYDGYRADFTKYRYVLDWMRGLKLFEEEDFDRYRNYLLDELVIELKRVCRYCSDRENTAAAIESILADGFYREFLQTGYRGAGGGLRRPLNRFALALLQKRRFDALIFFCTRVYRGGR